MPLKVGKALAFKDLRLTWAAVRMSMFQIYSNTSSKSMKSTQHPSILTCVPTFASVLVLQLINGSKIMQIYLMISMKETIEPRLVTMAKSNLIDQIVLSKSHCSGHMIQLLETQRITQLNYRESHLFNAWTTSILLTISTGNRWKLLKAYLVPISKLFIIIRRNSKIWEQRSRITSLSRSILT